MKGEGGFNEEAKDNISDGRIVEEHGGAISWILRERCVRWLGFDK